MTRKVGQRLPLIGAMLLGACDITRDAVITLDPSETHQRIEAWEATTRLWEFDKDADRFDGSWVAHREQILRHLILDEGITRLRLEIRSGAENPVDYWSQFSARKISYSAFKAHFYEKINDNADAEAINPGGFQFAELDFRVENIVLPAIAIARRYHRPLAINLNYVDFRWTDRQGTLSHADHPAEYAELIAATYSHLKSRWNLVPDELEIILEPDNSDRWRGEQIGRAMVATARRFRRDGITVPNMIAPSTASAAATAGYMKGIADVPGALPLLMTISYHRYDARLPDDTVKRIGAMGVSLGKRTAMLEHVDGDVEELFDDLILGNVSAWQLYGIAAKGDRPGYPIAVDDPTAKDPVVRLAPVGVQLAQVFRHVRPGAVRIGARSSRAALRAVAFRNPDGTMVVVVRPAAPGGGKWVRRLLASITPTTRYGFSVSGTTSGPYDVWRADRQGVLTACRSATSDGLSVATGEVITIAASTGMQLPPCSEV